MKIIDLTARRGYNVTDVGFRDKSLKMTLENARRILMWRVYRNLIIHTERENIILLIHEKTQCRKFSLCTTLQVRNDIDILT